MAAAKLIGLNIQIKGLCPTTENGFLLACNHLGYLDIIILWNCLNFRFIAKSEIGAWPFFGLLASLFGTLYCKRDTNRDSTLLLSNITQILKEKITVAFFPEGTSSRGEQLLPFKPMLFEAAVQSGASVLPVRIEYLSINNKMLTNEDLDLLAWFGDMEFTRHLLKLLEFRSISISVTFFPPIISKGKTRKQLAEETYFRINKIST